MTSGTTDDDLIARLNAWADPNGDSVARLFGEAAEALAAASRPQEERPLDVIGNAVHVMRIATGEIEDQYENRSTDGDVQGMVNPLGEGASLPSSRPSSYQQAMGTELRGASSVVHRAETNGSPKPVAGSEPADSLPPPAAPPPWQPIDERLRALKRYSGDDIARYASSYEWVNAESLDEILDAPLPSPPASASQPEDLSTGDLGERYDKLLTSWDECRQRLCTTEHALRILRDSMGGHQHWDREGTNGVNCPICITQREARERVDTMLASQPASAPQPEDTTSTGDKAEECHQARHWIDRGQPNCRCGELIRAFAEEPAIAPAPQEE